MKDIRTQWKVGAVFSFFLSLIMGLVNGGSYSFIYSLLWLFFGILFLFCIYKAFPRSWHLLVPLSGIYLFAFLGTLAFIKSENVGDAHLIVLGLISQFLALWSLFILLFTVTNRRDEVSAVLDYQKKKSPAPEVVSHTPLGFWSISLFFLLFACNLSIWYLADYQLAHTTKGIVGYVLCETTILLLWFYIFSIPETHIDLTPVEGVKPTTRFQRLGDFLRRFSLTKKVPSIGDMVECPGEKKSMFRKNIPCPKCGIFLVGEKRKCPVCSRVRRLAWCPNSDDFIVNCSRCRSLVKLSMSACDNCGHPISKIIKCPCGNESPLKAWSVERTVVDE